MVGSLRDIAQVVNDSAECNYSQLVTTEDGKVIVPTFDWINFFALRFKKFTNIKITNLSANYIVQFRELSNSAVNSPYRPNASVQVSFLPILSPPRRATTK